MGFPRFAHLWHVWTPGRSTSHRHPPRHAGRTCRGARQGDAHVTYTPGRLPWLLFPQLLAGAAPPLRTAQQATVSEARRRQREAAQAAATAAAAATPEKRQRARPGCVPRAPDVPQTRPGRVLSRLSQHARSAGSPCRTGGRQHSGVAAKVVLSCSAGVSTGSPFYRV
eukprot:gene22394-biopygen23725